MEEAPKNIKPFDYFEQKVKEVPLKIRGMIDAQFDSINEAENELWESFQEYNMAFVVDNFLRLGDEQARLDILGLIIEKRKNRDVELFLSALLKEIGTEAREKGGIVIASKSATRKEFFGRIFGPGITVKRYPTIETGPSYYTDIGTITKSKAIAKILAFFPEGRDLAPGGTLVASETLLSAGDRILGPFEADRDDFDETMMAKAKAQLQSLLGKLQTMNSSLVVFDSASGQLRISNDKTTVKFREDSPECRDLINEYVSQNPEKGGPIGKTGAYGLQDPQILKLVERISGDPYTVIGFPLDQLAEMLKQMGINIEIENDWGKIFEKTWGNPELVALAKEKIVPDKWGVKAERQFESLDFDEIASLISDNLGSVPLKIVELAANVGYFADRFAETLTERGFLVEKVISTDIEVRHDIRIKEMDLNNLGTEHPGEFNIVLINNPPGPNHMDWDRALESIKNSIERRGIVIWMSNLHKDDRYNLEHRVKTLGPESRILKLTDNFSFLLLVNPQVRHSL